MALLTLAGSRVLRATVTQPLTGAWHVEAAVDAQTVPTGAVSLVTEGLSLTGRAYRSRVYQDTLHVWLVGGAGGLRTQLGARGYRAPTVRVLLSDLMRETGETLSTTVAASLLARSLPSWSRVSGSASRALSTLAEALGVSWRVLDDGSIWLGVETWPTSSLLTYQLINDDVLRDRLIVASESPLLRPGTTFAGRRVANVVHTFEPSRVRSEAWLTA
jgi:hypothetical protein